MKKEKILMVVEAFGGGIFTYMKGLLNNIINDFDVVVLYSTRLQTPSNFKEFFDPKIKFIKSNYLKRNIGIHDIKALFEIKKIIKQETPNIIHAHSSKAGILVRLGVNSNKYKIFYTPHGYSFLMENVSELKRKTYKFIEKIAAINNSTTIACSKGEYEKSLELTKKSIYISNGVDLEDLKKYIPNKVPKINKDNLTIVTTGRISYQKNPKVFNKIAEKFSNIKFIWVGEGELRETLTSKNITVTGWKEKEELMEILNKSDIFLLPSLWEGLPISLLEAMALKKVCIVSNVIGNKDVIKNNVNGFVCNEFEDYVELIKKIMDGEYDLEQISQKGFDDIKNIYNTKVMSRQYLEIYKKGSL